MKRLLVCLFATVLSLGCSQNSSNLNSSNGAASPMASPAEKSVVQLMREGSAAYLAGEYSRAIVPYQKALELEQRDPKLEKTLWYVLVDNLAMSYGITGDLPNSRRVLEYGISRDDKYPMFHYILACTYGEQSDENNAILHLSKAYDRRENMIAGEEFPDPLTDDSFASLADRETFRRRVAEMKKAKAR